MTIAVRDVPGLGPKTAEYLVGQGITSAEELLEAGLAVLIAAPGFGDGRARKVLDAAASLVVDAEEAVLTQKKTKKKVKKKPKKKGADKKKPGKAEKKKKEEKKDKKKGGKKKDKKKDKKKKGKKKKK